MTEDLSVITTGDGSHSIYSDRFKDSYHSLHGAVRESQHVFIQSGLAFVIKSIGIHDVRLLELGFGTGLNLLLSHQFVKIHPPISLYYESWEAYPLPPGIINQLHYETFLPDLKEIQPNIHELSWNRHHPLTNQITLLKQLKHFEELEAEEDFNLIFFDAFAPQKQPYLWQEPFLEKIAKSARKGAVLVTYCAQGAFRRALAKVGFEVTKLPGPPGKREMIRAIKKA